MSGPRDLSDRLVDAQIIEGFVETYLRHRYDDAVEIPECHRDWWRWYCADDTKGALAAPRGHAKSTSITFACVLCEALFGEASFFVILTATEELVKNFINELKKELHENDQIREDFAPEFLKETETELVVRCANGVFRVLGKGAEQKIRGIKWRGMRPDRVIGDDLETDESVENPDRRRKFMKWFQNALLQVGSRKTKYRIVGTILHLDSMLERLLNSKLWLSLRYAAHNADFSEILWPEMFPRERLLSIRSEFADNGNLEGYSMEYLNNPVDASSALFKQNWLRPMLEEDFRFFQVKKGRTFYVSGDLAISKQSHADYTAIGVAGVGPDGLWHLVDVRRGRFDTLEIIEILFDLQKIYDPAMFLIEGGTIEKAITPVLNAEMRRRHLYLNMVPVSQPTANNKIARAKGVTSQLRAGQWRFDKESSWYADFEDEILRFPKSKNDDQVDFMSQFSMIADQAYESQTDKELQEEEADAAEPMNFGSAICGY